MIDKETSLNNKSPTSIAWCDQVTEIPEETNKTVLRKGIPLGSKAKIPIGGQIPPNSKEGVSAK